MWERDSQVREVFEEFSGVDTTEFSLKRLPITGHSRTVAQSPSFTSASIPLQWRRYRARSRSLHKA